MRNNENKKESWKFAVSYLFRLVLIILVLGIPANAQKQTLKVNKLAAHPEESAPLYNEYRGVRIGMTMQEVRTKLGEPKLKDDSMDFYVISENETAQIAYSADHKVKVISTDYVGGIGAPDHQSVVGLDLIQRPDGSLYQRVNYEKEKFWVSYHRSTSGTVTITIQVAM